MVSLKASPAAVGAPEGYANPVAVGSETELIKQIERLRMELALQERQSSSKEQLAAVRALSNAVEARAGYGGKHAERVTAFALEIAQALELSLSEKPEIEFGFLLHDIGKVAIPDAILSKPAALTDEEQALMKRHALIGAQIVDAIDLGGAADVVRSHHERWDGQGYPDGLAGEQIPAAARVLAVADVLDALTTKRPYRPASSLSAAREIITRQAGAQFDPGVVDAFNSVPDSTFEQIRARIG